jgi:hypothetical protein
MDMFAYSVVSCQFLGYVAGEILLDFAVSWNGLAYPRFCYKS